MNKREAYNKMFEMCMNTNDCDAICANCEIDFLDEEKIEEFMEDNQE